MLIPAAREHVERVTSRSLITQTWEYYLDHFPVQIHLPKPPLQSVSSIVYTDTGGDEQTLSTDVYQVDTDSEPGRIYEKYSQAWPSVRDIPKAIKVTYIAGYGDDSTDVPTDILLAMRILITHWYENREFIVVGTITAEIRNSVNALLSDHRIRHF